MRIALVSCALATFVVATFAGAAGCTPAATPAPVDPAVTLVVNAPPAPPASVIEAPSAPVATSPETPEASSEDIPEPPVVVPGGRQPKQQTPPMRLSTLRCK